MHFLQGWFWWFYVLSNLSFSYFNCKKSDIYLLQKLLHDRLSGLIVDIFGDLAVIASSAAWVQIYQHQIMDCLSRLNNIKQISWRPTVEILKEEGLDLSDLKKTDLIIPQTRVKVRSVFIWICCAIQNLFWAKTDTKSCLLAWR